MTDGCGFANAAFFAALKKHLKTSDGEMVPSAVQVRINGAKVATVFHLMALTLM